MKRTIQAEKLLPNIKTLRNRIRERFPNRSLSRVCADLYDAALEAQTEAEEIAKPNIYLRVSIGLLIFLVVTFLIRGLISLEVSVDDFGVMDFVTFFESTINDVVFIGAGIFFLVSIENRIKRSRTLEKLNELRVLAHVIDMHQLTKDPEGILKRGSDTHSSPRRDMTSFELTRYLDYCSEMLSMIGKIAVIYLQNFDDQIVLRTVNEIEALTTGLSRKIWQKIMILHQFDEEQLEKSFS